MDGTTGSREIAFFVGNKRVPKETAERAPILACGNMLGTTDAVVAFDDDLAFLRWAEKMPNGEKFYKLTRLVDEVRKLEHDDLTQVKEARKRRTQYLTRELEELASRRKMAVNSAEVFLEATAAGCHPLEGAILDPAIIYEHINFGGSWRPLAATIPDFRWIGFNDKASSMRVSGAGILFQDTWYRGRKFYFGGVPTMDFPDFRQFAFNDLASSVVLT